MARMDTSTSLARGRSYYATIASFPIACFVLAWFTDLAYWATASVLWETMSVWLITVGLFAVGLAVLAGLVDLVRSRRTAGLGQPWQTLLGHVLAVILSLVNVFVHSRDGYTAVVPQGLVLSTAVVLVLLLTTLWARPRATTAQVGGYA